MSGWSVISAVDPETGKTKPLYKLKRDPQCVAKDFLSSCQCQGTKGHKDDHWAYGPCGELRRWGKWGASQTPPGHKDYIDPIDMQDKRPQVHSVEIKNGRGRTIPKDECRMIKRRMKAAKKSAAKRS